MIITRGSCSKCHRTRNLCYPCSCGAPAEFDRHGNRIAEYVFVGTWWRPWTWGRKIWFFTEDPALRDLVELVMLAGDRE